MTDLQPLVSILNTKTLDGIENPTQQAMKEKIQQMFNIKVKWQPGKKMTVSHALSRAPVEEAPSVNKIENYQTKIEKYKRIDILKISIISQSELFIHSSKKRQRQS